MYRCIHNGSVHSPYILSQVGEPTDATILGPYFLRRFSWFRNLQSLRASRTEYDASFWIAFLSKDLCKVPFQVGESM